MPDSTINFVFRSSISDSGIGMICNVFPDSLSRLLLALCPNISSSNHLSLFMFFLCTFIFVKTFEFAGSWFPITDKVASCSSGGIQFATAELPLLELMDCGMTICDPNSQDSTSESGDHEISKPPNSKFHLIYQKLIIKHNHLKKLSLWGCSGLDVRLFRLYQSKLYTIISAFLVCSLHSGPISQLPSTRWSQPELLQKFASRWNIFALPPNWWTPWNHNI